MTCKAYKHISGESTMEENLKLIISEGSRVCREHDIKADNSLIAYMACLLEVAAGSSDEGGIASPMEPQQVAQLARRIAGELNKKRSPVLAATKMQVMMDVAFKQQQELVEAGEAERAEQMDMLARAVIHARPPRDNSTKAHEQILARMLEYVATAAGIEAALTDDIAREEVRLAMESVFSFSALARFYTLSEEDRAQQMQELARITLGICLFNREVGRGGYALPPGTSTYMPQANRLLRDIGRHVAELSTEVQGCAAVQRISSSRPKAQSGKTEVEDEKNRAQAESVWAAQALVLFENLREDLQGGLDTVETLEAELNHLLLQAQDTVGGANAVSKEAVFPLFNRLGALHMAMAEELRVLVVRQRLYEDLEKARSQAVGVSLLQQSSRGRRPGKKTPVEAELEAMAQEAEAMPKGQPPRQPAESVEFTVPTESSPPAYTQLALNGFDAVAIAKQGLLQRGNPSLGCVRLRGEKDEDVSKLYCFAGWEALDAFASDPVTIDKGLRAAVIRQPVLARLLGLGSEYGVLDVHKILTVVSGPLKVDFGCQTPIHFCERHIDHKYEWNEWALRRRALQLTNLRQKATHSTQTGLSHFKRDTDTQVWVPKAAQVQTPVNKGQTMPKKLRYITGLRGPPSTKMNIVKLDLELGQSHQH